MTRILGISAFYHDSSAVLLQDGDILAAVQEERFTRRKHDDAFPEHAITYCLGEAGISAQNLDAVVFYEKPLQKFHRLLETYASYAPAGLPSYLKAMPLWLEHRLHIPKIIRKHLPEYAGPLLYTNHHESHAASAFFPSPFERAAILTIDGVGEWTTAAIGAGQGNHLKLIKQLRFPHSLGLLYSAFTGYCGFRVNSGEYKLMGLAPYARADEAQAIAEKLLGTVVDLKEDGSFRLNMRYFRYCQGLTMFSRSFEQLLGGPARKVDTPIEQRHMDIAGGIQRVTEKIVFNLARHARAVTGENNLVVAGGVGLNCVANGLLVREGTFDEYFFQPAAGDAGGALGAALFAWHQLLDNPRYADGKHDSMKGCQLGPEFSCQEVRSVLDSSGAKYREMASEAELLEKTAELLAEDNVVGWFQGRMEYGPRALGNRSILGDPRKTDMQSRMNLKIKFRESFRPFAPIVLAEKQNDYFDLPSPSPYMLRVGSVKQERRLEVDDNQQNCHGLERLHLPRSDISAVTHVDYSARIQSVADEQNPLLHALLSRFDKKTGCAVLVNTSFNVRGEPIVCTPADALNCFLQTDMDALVIESFLLEKKDQAQEATRNDYLVKFQKQDNPDENFRLKTFAQSIPRASASQVRAFGGVFFTGCFILGLLHQWRRCGFSFRPAEIAQQFQVPWGWWLTGTVIGIFAITLPSVARPLYTLWMLFGKLLGWFVLRIMLTGLFFLVVTPLGLCYRRWCKVITKGPSPALSSYWEQVEPIDDVTSYRHLY